MKINKRKLKQIIREEYKQISETHMDMIRSIEADEARADREMVYPLRDNMTQKALEDCAADRRDAAAGRAGRGQRRGRDLAAQRANQAAAS